MNFFSFFLTLLSMLYSASGSAFTFEVPDGERRCYFNTLKKGDTSKIEFQVISGGNFDIDMTLLDPADSTIKTIQREQYSYFDYEPDMDGDYQLCFSNEFSSFTHKVVFMSWDTPSDFEDGPEHGETPLTLMDNVIFSVHEHLRKAEQYQMRNRLQEEASRSFIEALNDRVTYGSIMQFILIAVVAFGQVYLLRSLFKDPVPHRNRMAVTSTVQQIGY